MSRAVRRHPVVTKPGKRVNLKTTRQAAVAARKTGVGHWYQALFPRWAQDIVAELRRVVWPSRQNTMHLTLVVVVVSAAVGLILGGIDIGFSELLRRILTP